jgi:hypothetical protein
MYSVLECLFVETDNIRFLPHHLQFVHDATEPLDVSWKDVVK